MNRDIKTIYTAVTSAFLVAGAALLGGCEAEGQDGVPPPFASKAKVASKMVDREFDVQKKFDAVTKRYEKALDEFAAIEINMRMMPVSAIQPDAPRLSRKNIYESFLMAGANGVHLAEVYVQGRTRYPSCGYLVERLGNNTDPGEAAVEAALHPQEFEVMRESENEIRGLYGRVSRSMEMPFNERINYDGAFQELDTQLDGHFLLMKKVKDEIEPKTNAYFARMQQTRLLLEANARNCDREMRLP